MSKVAHAITSLCPDSEFLVENDDYSTVTWIIKPDKVPTQAEIDAEIPNIIKANDLTALRSERNRKLAETDWWASSDLTLSDEQKKYRQDLRDITKSATSLDDVTWPTKPE